MRTLTTNVAEVQGRLTANTGEIGRIRTTLGDRLTTLMFELDQRYMPRGELELLYISRREHEQAERDREKDRRSWLRQWPAITIAALVLIVQAITLIHVLT